MIVGELYDKYDLMPQLRLHQLRVGGVVKTLTNDHDSIITALLHDMGNIVKFDLDNPIIDINNLDHWKNVQKNTIKKYGNEAHVATYKILSESGLDRYAKYLKEESRTYDMETDKLNQSFFSNLSMPALTTLYADLRVSINGVVSMEERINDLVTRYSAPRVEAVWGDMLEKIIRDKFGVDPKEITEYKVSKFFDQLLTYPL